MTSQTRGESEFALQPTSQISTKFSDTGRINLAIATSIREIVGDEQVGKVNQTYHEYLKSLSEHLALLLNRNSDMAETYNLAAILTDDRNPVYQVPFTSSTRPWPEEAYSTIRSHSGDLIRTPRLDELVINIPPEFKAGQVPSLVQIANTLHRSDSYWEKVVAAMRDLKVDVLLMHSYIAFMGDPMVADEDGAFTGRVLNLHPGITNPHNPRRLPGWFPNRDALTRAKNGGWNQTGASLRVVEQYRGTASLDRGPVIFDLETTRVDPSEDLQDLKFRNYATQMGVVEQGLVAFAHDQSARAGILESRQVYAAE